MPNINKAVQFMIDTAKDDTHGYDQTHRNAPDYDCSSLVATALHEGGFNVSPYSWTGNLEEQLRACSFTDCKPPWKPGDVHLNVNHHVCMSVTPTTIAQASINEKGTTTGGKTGDQTGKEIYIRDYYEYSRGWDCHLRYIGANVNTGGMYSVDTIARQVIAGSWGTGKERKILLTKSGYNYVAVQNRVNEIMKGEKKTNGEIAREVINGKWGNGDTRKSKLTSAGYNYTAIQKLVNDILSSK